MTTTTTTTKPRNAWVHPIGLIGVLLAVAYRTTHSPAVGGMAVSLLALAGIGAIIGYVRPAAPLTDQVAVGGSLVGMRIRHSGGLSTVTEDVGGAARRTVTALDTHGRTHRLCVGVDPDGRVIEAAVPGVDWAGAEAV